MEWSAPGGPRQSYLCSRLRPRTHGVSGVACRSGVPGGVATNSPPCSGGDSVAVDTSALARRSPACSVVTAGDSAEGLAEVPPGPTTAAVRVGVEKVAEVGWLGGVFAVGLGGEFVVSRWCCRWRLTSFQKVSRRSRWVGSARAFNGSSASLTSGTVGATRDRCSGSLSPTAKAGSSGALTLRRRRRVRAIGFDRVILAVDLARL